VVQRRQPEHLLVPVELVVLWAAGSPWLLGLGSDHDEDGAAPR
jgi:hypothetical protein